MTNILRAESRAETPGGQEKACVYFTDVVNFGESFLRPARMAKKGDRKKMKADGAAAIRVTISFPPEVYETLEIIAKQKKVSLAWVVREAADQYLAEKWPLLRGQGGPRT